jgi:DICT domain-containing protein/predicted DNA-binding transcriptional regulator AlpA
VSANLRIRDVAERTGVSEATLRMWESRHGFPSPQRLPSGHRRYSPADVEQVAQVLADREQGLSLAAAIERARDALPGGDSLFAALRQRLPDLQVHSLTKRTLLAMSHAVEDESCALAERPLLFASFQRERHYRQAEARWRELTTTAERAVVFADFDRERHPGGGPIELPIDPGERIGREWSVVCEAADHAVCLTGWEPPGQQDVPEPERVFETIWTVDRKGTREAARICTELAARSSPALAEDLRTRLDSQRSPGADGELGRAVALTNRMVAYVAADTPR